MDIEQLKSRARKRTDGKYLGELLLGKRFCSTYVFQTYSVLQVLGASNMNQEEANIRDHVHGNNGVSIVIPTGTLFPWAGQSNTAPANFLFCDGSAVSRTTYATLFQALVFTATATVTIASPAVVTINAHGFQTNDPIKFTTTGALPTGITAGTTYYVKKIDANTFNIAATPGGTNINTTGTQSGVHTGISTLWGDGDGSTTFNLPDLRGRLVAGRDALGGTTANRITSGNSGVNGDTPGATGGSETFTLASTNIPNFGLSHNAGTVTGSSKYTGNAKGTVAATPNGGATITTGTAGAAKGYLPPVGIIKWIIKV